MLPDGLDIVRAVDAADCRPGTLAEQMHASLWRLELAADPAELAAAVARLLAAESVPVERLTKDGVRSLDARAPIVTAQVSADRPKDRPRAVGLGEVPGGVPAEPSRGRNDIRAILELVVRQVTPAVRPDDVLTALRTVAGFAPSQPPRATRLAQGPVDDAGRVTDPLCTTELPVSPAAPEH